MRIKGGGNTMKKKKGYRNYYQKRIQKSNEIEKKNDIYEETINRIEKCIQLHNREFMT